MSDAETIGALKRENDYLKARNAQLEADVVDLAAESARLRQVLERAGAARMRSPPNPLGGGQ